MNGSRDRRLSDSERVLWREITRSIAPLRLRPADDGEAEDNVKPQPRTITSRPGATKPQAQKAKVPPSLTPLGRRVKQRVARGKDAIDGRIDLHGLTQAEAHAALLRFLLAAQSRDARLVMVITGKGRSTEGGVLKRQVPLWLALPEFRAMVVGFEEAHQRHGGEGALYLRVRRTRE